MGAATTASNPADFANRLQTFFNPKLLETLTFELAIADYGLRGKFPAHGTSIRFFRPRRANTSGVGTLTEGTTPTNLTEVAVGYVDVTLTQKGALSTITDIVTALDLLNTVQLHVKTQGADAALHLDGVIRDALVTGLANSNTNFNSFFERFAGVKNTGVSATDFATLAGGNQANGKISRAVHIGCVTTLKRSLVPTINGKYVAVTPPEVIHDMRQDTTWVQAAVYDVGTLYKRAQLMLDGCVFVEAMNPFIEDNVYGTADSTDDDGSGLIYSTIYLGQDAFGVPELANDKAGSNPYAPKLIILAAPDKADKLNQIVSIGWKAYYGAKPLITTTDGSTPVSGEVPRYVQLRTKTTYA